MSPCFDRGLSIGIPAGAVAPMTDLRPWDRPRPNQHAGGAEDRQDEFLITGDPVRPGAAGRAHRYQWTPGRLYRRCRADVNRTDLPIAADRGHPSANERASERTVTNDAVGTPGSHATRKARPGD